MFLARGHWIILPYMLGLTDNQLTTVMGMARTLPVEKRDLYLQRIAQRGRGHAADVTDVAKLALTGLAHQPAAARHVIGSFLE